MRSPTSGVPHERTLQIPSQGGRQDPVASSSSDRPSYRSPSHGSGNSTVCDGFAHSLGLALTRGTASGAAVDCRCAAAERSPLPN